MLNNFKLKTLLEYSMGSSKSQLKVDTVKGI